MFPRKHFAPTWCEIPPKRAGFAAWRTEAFQYAEFAVPYADRAYLYTYSQVISLGRGQLLREFADFLRPAGDLARTLELARRAAELDPNGLLTLSYLAPAIAAGNRNARAGSPADR